MIEKFDVIIIGGGIVGLTFASLLARNQQLKIALIEHKPPELTWDEKQYGLRTSALNRASENILKHAQVWQILFNDRISFYDKMQVFDHTFLGSINFSATDILEKDLGFIIENRVLIRALWNQINLLPNIEIFIANINDITVESNKAHVQMLINQKVIKKITADLIVGADGQSSMVRSYAKISKIEHDYNQSALICNVKTENAHNNTARQIFLIDGPLAFLPLADQSECSIVWSLPPELAIKYRDMHLDEFNCTIANASNFMLGEIHTISERACFPLKMMHANKYCIARVALIGDAAHVIHPLAGQGVNLGLLDAAALAEILLNAINNKREDLGSINILRKYERSRVTNNIMMQSIMTGFKRLFGSNLAIIKYARNYGLKVLDKFAIGKREIIQGALGIKGDLPKFALTPKA